ncbi:hypothetical protein KPP03845_100045 [Streptomyces xanthophaeus]|nr:hypothetical protein KPP03845_100045 [Streptomyces xanthophaeus]
MQAGPGRPMKPLAGPHAGQAGPGQPGPGASAAPPAFRTVLSPVYALGELARAMAGIDHLLAGPLCVQAAERLLAGQSPDGGW